MLGGNGGRHDVLIEMWWRTGRYLDSTKVVSGARRPLRAYLYRPSSGMLWVRGRGGRPAVGEHCWQFFQNHDAEVSLSALRSASALNPDPESKLLGNDVAFPIAGSGSSTIQTRTVDGRERTACWHAGRPDEAANYLSHCPNR